jgi:histone acetyltransferase 1
VLSSLTRNPHLYTHLYVQIDRITHEEAFKKQVEADAISFRPMGEKIHSYIRRRGNGKSKDKREIVARKTVEQENLNEEDEDAVVYEVYHVCTLYSQMSHAERMHRRTGIRLVSPNFIDVCRYSSSFTSRPGLISRKTKRNGNSSCCEAIRESNFDLMTSPYRFEKRKRKDGQATYHFVGYSSLYPFYFFPDSTRLRLRSVLGDFPSAETLLIIFMNSQFVIIGPYQKRGHGGEFM